MQNLQNKLITLFMKFHIWMYEQSNGRFGSKLAGIPMLLLYVRGRKSGKAYAIPLAYHQHGDDYIIVASNNAQSHNPGWYYNVLADDSPKVRVGNNVVDVSAREITGEEKVEVWQAAIQTNPAWAGYKERTDRDIPVIALKPTQP